MRYVIDRAPAALTNLRRTAVGGYLVDATLARVGVLRYTEKDAGGARKTFNPPEVLQASLDALATAPVTHRHPAKFVDPQSYGAAARGHVVGQPTFDAETGQIKAQLAIQDATLIEAIESGDAREVSLGYLCNEVSEPGEYNGEAYDTARTEINWNHIAIVPKGRAGSGVCLALDSADIPGEGEEDSMKVKVKINGKEVEMAAQDAVDAQAGLLEQADEALVEANKKIAELEAKVSKEALDALVDERLKALDEEKALEAKRAAVAKAYPKLDLSGKSVETIDALHATIDADKEVTDLAPGAKSTAAKPEGTEAQDEAPKPKRPRARDRMLVDLQKVSQRA